MCDEEYNKEEKPTWLGKNCKDCGNEKCKKLGTLPKGYDCALWQAESVFTRIFCLHEWVRMDSTLLAFTHLGARCMWVCKKCGKTAFYPNY